ncbi:lipoate--protein ligase [Mesomycoplasma lagogenitalium]|uniref:lipoate--protein ligase n=1 Tax=Mesomycoplasma lagogenitalium TaxID=171286 RepID=A0ABY8LWE2_9BACT|nr:lipoate--protein ligase [Mesomycoplasma lagogenitalium]WGI36736.1 lipoate--protein ligase [Mesomycoplasma lagogenitalium]
MKIFVSKNYSPFYNLVLEELMIKDDNNKEDIVYLYQHNNAVIIGRNQNAHSEVKFDVLEKENIDLYRRNSGGGAVYHDLGNLNFSFITKKDERSYEKFLEPVMEFLKTLNLNVEFKGRNDLVVNGSKFSGNAQFIYKDKMVHHGTILFNVDLTKLSKVLNPSKLKMESKGIKSARQRVTNLLDELEQKISIQEFIDKFALFLKEKYNATDFIIPENYYQKIDEIAEYKKSNDWLLGKNPEFSFFNEAKTDGGILQIKANVIKNKIDSLQFQGDFLSKADINEIIPLFLNKNYDKKEIENILNSISNLNDYFGTITIDEIISIMFGE